MPSVLSVTKRILKELEKGPQHEADLFIRLRYAVKPEISYNYRQAKNSQLENSDRVRLGSRLYIRDTLSNLRSRGVVVREPDGIWRLSDAYKCIPDKYKGTPKAGVFMKGWLAAKNEEEIPKYKAIHLTEVCEEGYSAGQPSQAKDEMTKKARRSIKVKDVLPNPFRNMDTYPIDREKVEALKTSITDTDFWDNLLARPHPTKRGKVQLAYGHHRLVALQELDIEETEIPVRKLDDATMIRIMADENLQDWKTDAGVVVETVSAAKEFLDNELAKCKTWEEFKKSELHKTMRFNNAQTFMAVKGKKGVGETTLLKFLGRNWKQWMIQEALAILKDVEKGVLDLKAAQVFPNLHQASEFRKTVREIKPDRKEQIRLAKNLEEKWSQSDYDRPKGKPSKSKSKRKGSSLPEDQVEALRALSTSLTTAQKLITWIEGKKGKGFWLEADTELQKYVKRINQTANELTTLLNERFSSKSR